MKKLLKNLKYKLLNAKNRIRLKKFFTYTLPFNAIIILEILFIGWILDKQIESVLYTSAHLILRYKFNKVLHCKSTLACFLTTTLINFCSIYITVRLEESLISACVSAFCICWLGFIIEDWLEAKIDQSKWIQLRETKVDFGMDETLLRTKCKYVGLTEIATERIVQRYVYHKSEYDLAVAECVELDTIKKSLQRSRKRLRIKESE